MASLPALFLPAQDFADMHKMHVDQVYQRLNCGDFPEVEKQCEAGKRYVNLVLLADWLKDGRVTLTDLNKHKKEKGGKK